MIDPVFEGTWEDVVRQADRLAGKRVRLVVVESGQDRGAEPTSPCYATATPEERVRAWDEWCSLPRPQAPLLSDYAVSREGIYAPDRD